MTYSFAQESRPVPGSRVELIFRSGSAWSHVKWFGPVRVTLTPQIAVWLEDTDGTYAGDLFVTEKSGKSTWGNVRRPEALPVWSHARGVRYSDGLFMPTKAAPLSDAVSGATPKAKKSGDSICIRFSLPSDLPAGAYRLMVEVNSSFDYNTAFPERKNDVNGQPSVVYAIPLTWDDSPSAGTAAILGTGDPAGSGGVIRPGVGGLDSALQIVENLAARFPTN